MRLIECSEMRAPAKVLDIDMAADCDELIDVTTSHSAWCLVRSGGVAVAKRFVDVSADTTIALSEFRALLGTSNLPRSDKSAELVVPTVPKSTITVIICTRNRGDGLIAILESLANQSDHDFDVLVVDNSDDGEVALQPPQVDGLVLRCCHEPMRGLSRARNRGLAEAESDIVAWIDDDEVADPDWIAWLRSGFASSSRPDAVAGVMLPAELETTAQVNFERYGGFNKGRGMAPELLVGFTPTAPDPLYPLPNFGAGGNMAFRTEALRRIGGFDNRLGAGTLTHGGEETRALSLLLEVGGTILHWPPAVTWHYHRRTDEALREQFYGYSAGLTAFYMSLIMTSPKYIGRIAGFAPAGVKRILANRRLGKAEGPPVDFPRDLLRAGRRGLVEGAWLYLRERRRQRHA